MRAAAEPVNAGDRAQGGIEAGTRPCSKGPTRSPAMPTLDPRASTLVLIDFQTRLMPVIDKGDAAIANARRLSDAAAMLGVPVFYTEQYSKGLGITVPELAAPAEAVLQKMTFGAVETPGFLERLGDTQAIVAGVEAHVCVLQTVLGLIERGRRVYVVRDAISSRRPDSCEAAVRRMERHGAEIVTTEMVIFEWLGTAEHPKFREAVGLIK